MVLCTISAANVAMQSALCRRVALSYAARTTHVSDIATQFACLHPCPSVHITAIDRRAKTAIQRSKERLSNFQSKESKIFGFISRMMLARRLLREYSEIAVQMRTDFQIQNWQFPLDQWRIELTCPESQLWSNKTFDVELTFSPDYPRVLPRVRFVNPIPFHPNVAPDGEVCFSARFGRCSVVEIVEEIQRLLENPNASSPANLEALELFSSDFGEYRNQVERSVKRTRMHPSRIA
jgi:ubiquitin-conjugating enzyme E2 G1